MELPFSHSTGDSFVPVEIVTREEAGQMEIPFGKYKGMTLDLVSQMNGGIAFLEQLLKERSVGAPLKSWIRIFLYQDPSLKEVD
jgi:hypothetical protein